MTEIVSTDDVRVPVGPLLGWTVQKAPWGPHTQWHAAHDLPCVPRTMPESYKPEAAAGSAATNGGGAPANAQQQQQQQQQQQMQMQMHMMHQQQMAPPGYPLDPSMGGVPGGGGMMGMDGTGFAPMGMGGKGMPFPMGPMGMGGPPMGFMGDPWGKGKGKGGGKGGGKGFMGDPFAMGGGKGMGPPGKGKGFGGKGGGKGGGWDPSQQMMGGPPPGFNAMPPSAPSGEMPPQ